MSWIGIGIGGAEGTRVAESLGQQQILQMQSKTVKVQIATVIMGGSEVKAQCGSGFCMCSSLSNRIVVSNSPMYFDRSPVTAWSLASLFLFRNKSMSSLAQFIVFVLIMIVSYSYTEIT
jgi:hypothetical protein